MTAILLIHLLFQNPATETEKDLLKIRQQREEVFKIRQEREEEVFKIQQEREEEVFKIQQERERSYSKPSNTELSYSKSGNSWKARKYYKVAGIASVGSAKVAGLLLLCEGQDGPCINDNEP